MHARLILIALVPLAPAMAAQAQPDEPPPLKREFRGVWVATVGNIDWPSKKGLATEEQKKELVAILDKAAALRLNAVIFQVRPMCDALYRSKLEPWSEYLTGELGKAPDPPYDPLEFAVKEAHARGQELHAWFNPFRAHHPSATSEIPTDHLVKARPELAKQYGKHYWLNPTNKDARDHSLAVILDVVKRYDIDGIHLDDYFYPYKEKGADNKPLPFPDDDTWAAYQKSGGQLSREDWRRDAINQFVRRMYQESKKVKPWLKVGISPFGIWRPGHPEGISGFDQYAELYADAKLWLNEGWVDYFSPQLYWPIKQEKQSYPRLLEWWVSENTKGRHVWPGNIPSRVTGKEKGWPAEEIAEQVRVTRKTRGASGNIHFSIKPLLRNTGGVADALKSVYTEIALPPAVPWAKLDQPPRPDFAWDKDKKRLKIHGGETGRWFVVRAKVGKEWTTHIVAARPPGAYLTFTERPSQVVVTRIDHAGQESPPTAADVD